ncbi:MAG: peptidyl-prolyl cis-trans isomerase [Boseongicola sp.]
MKAIALRIFSEPLIQFLVLGGALFVIYGALNTDDEQSAEANVIDVSPADIDRLSSGFEQAWRRTPDETEIDGLVDNFIREEVLVREAENLGLDRGDAVIRQRLVQKMDFLMSSVANSLVGTDEELSVYLNENPKQFRTPGKIAIQQVYLGERPEETEIESVRQELAEGADHKALGQITMLPAAVPLLPDSAIDSQFGSGFSAALSELPLGTWSGPFRSGFGIHFIRVTEREEPIVPQLSEIRAAVERDWRQSVATEQTQLQYELIAERFEIRRPAASE